jgi:hypothetical protein
MAIHIYFLGVLIAKVRADDNISIDRASIALDACPEIEIESRGILVSASPKDERLVRLYPIIRIKE